MVAYVTKSVGEPCESFVARRNINDRRSVSVKDGDKATGQMLYDLAAKAKKQRVVGTPPSSLLVPSGITKGNIMAYEVTDSEEIIDVIYMLGPAALWKIHSDERIHKGIASRLKRDGYLKDDVLI